MLHAFILVCFNKWHFYPLEALFVENAVHIINHFFRFFKDVPRYLDDFMLNNYLP